MADIGHLVSDDQMMLGLDRDLDVVANQAPPLARPLSLLKSAMVLKSGAGRLVSHTSSTLRPASRSSSRLDATCLIYHRHKASVSSQNGVQAAQVQRVDEHLDRTH